MKKLFYLLALVGFTTITACTINDNVPGPAGPPGPPGTANVIGTEHIALNTWFYNSQQKWYAADINVPELTADIANFGMVMVYQQLSGGSNPVWIPLPDTYGNLTTNFDFYRGGVTVYRFNVDNTTPIAPTGMVVRVVLIPAAMKNSNPEVNWQNYQEVESLLKLQE